MSARSIHGPLALFLGALKSVLRELPREGTGLRVDPGPAGYVTVTLQGPDGALATCTVAQRTVPRSDARQLTIDDVLARGPKPAAAAPAADTSPAPPARSPATVADDRGEDWGEDGREYPDGDHRTLVVSRSQLDTIIGALGVHTSILDVTRLGPTPRPPTRPASSPLQQLWVAASEWASLSPEVRDELGEHVRDGWRREGDWYTATPYEDAAGYVYDKLCREGVAVHLEPPPAPAPAKKPAKASKKLYRDQGHGHDRAHTHPNTAYLAGPDGDMERPKGRDDAAWRALVAQTVAGAPAATWRLYGAKGKCLWDSRDGGQP